MTRPSDDDELAILLRALPAAEPPPDLLAGARRQYREALVRRARREAVLSLVVAGVSLALFAGLVQFFFEPADLIAWVAVAAAEATRWIAGGVTVLSIVSPVAWGVMAAGAALSLLPAIVLTRMGRVPAMK
jgi:hypothetical protein